MIARAVGLNPLPVTTVPNHVVEIVGPSTPSKVCQCIVIWVVIPVKRFHTVRTWTREREEDQPVNEVASVNPWFP